MLSDRWSIPSGADRRPAAYLRVSTEAQGDGFGLDAQREKVWEFASGQVGVDAGRMQEYVDVGHSGASLERPALQRLLDDAERGALSHVFVARWDRLARDVTLDGFLRYRLGAAKVVLLSASETNGVDPISQMTATILAAVAQYERTLIQARMAAGRRLKAQAGGYAGGQPPYGYRAVDGQLCIHQEEWLVLGHMRQMRHGGLSYAAIAGILNSDGVRPRSGSAWHPSSVRSVLGAHTIEVVFDKSPNTQSFDSRES